jgi:hypothetical protein
MQLLEVMVQEGGAVGGAGGGCGREQDGQCEGGGRE